MQQTLFGPPKEIRSLAEYIEAVNSRPKEQEKRLPHPRYLYRGHADAEYTLKPSIERDEFDVSMEGRLIEMARNRRPDVFGIDDKLSLLAKMQHYGLPTRLIDFTTNPLVALYFACQSNSKSVVDDVDDKETETDSVHDFLEQGKFGVLEHHIWNLRLYILSFFKTYA